MARWDHDDLRNKAYDPKPEPSIKQEELSPEAPIESIVQLSAERIIEHVEDWVQGRTMRYDMLVRANDVAEELVLALRPYRR